MIKNKIILLMISLSLFMPSTIYADCTIEEKNNFKKIDYEYKVTYTFDIDTKMYKITFNNPSSDKYGYIIKNNNDEKKIITDLTTVTDNNFEISDIEPGKYEIEVVSTTKTCNSIYKTIKLDLPKYNKYYNDPQCEGIEEFVLCQTTYDKDIDYETFTSRVNSYKKNHSKKDNTNETKSKIKEQNKIIKYIQDNLFQIMIITIFIILVIITIILTAKSIKKSRRLE